MTNSVQLRAGVPVDVGVDLQSIHKTAFQIFTRVGDRFEVVKEGTADATFTISTTRLAPGLIFEFVYFKRDEKFRAAIVFAQGDQKQLVEMDADGDKRICVGEITFDVQGGGQ